MRLFYGDELRQGMLEELLDKLGQKKQEESKVMITL